MKEFLTEKSNLFEMNKKAVLNSFKWDSNYMTTAAAAAFAALGEPFDAAAMKSAEEILKQNSSLFSEYRDYAKLPILVQMVHSGDPEGRFEQIKTVYEKLMEKKLFNSTERMLAALVIVNNSSPEKYDHYVERTLSIFNRMKENHFFLTDESDIPYAAILAISDIPEDKLLQDTEESYNLLKTLFPMRSSNNLLSLAYILSLNKKSPKEKTAQVKEFCEIMNSKKHGIPDGSVLPIYGSLSMMNDNLGQTADDLIDTYDYLKSLNGLGFFSLDSNLRYIYAAMFLLSSAELRDMPAFSDSSEKIAMSAALHAAITMQTCLIACILSSASVSANSLR